MARQVINFSSSGDNVLIAAVGGALINIYRMKLLCAGATIITIKDGFGNVLDGPLNFAANQGMILDYSPEPWYTASNGSSFIINSSQAVAVGGLLEYGQP